jgi:polar amino acid transport system substrate-binding protein
MKRQIRSGASALGCAAGITALLALAGCTTPTIEAGEVSEVTAPPVPPGPPPATAPVANPDCKGFEGNKVVASYPSNPAPSPAPTVEAIRSRGKLIAGVSADTLLFGARNPFTGNLEGLDIDLINELAKVVFGTANAAGKVQYRVITYAERIPLLEAGDIDVVAHSMTINCARWNQIAFSSEYYTAGQTLLVRSDEQAESITKMKVGSRICVPDGGTSVETLEAPEFASRNFKPVLVGDITECLVKFQQGQTDAILSDDIVVAGMAAQDPYTRVLGGKRITQEPYGMGFNKSAIDLVQVANAMLDTLRENGGLKDRIVANKISSADAAVVPPGDTSRPLPQ